MDIQKLRIGNFVFYQKEPYAILCISCDKLGLVAYNDFQRCYNWKFGSRHKIKFVKTSLCEPIPLLDVLTNDDRFKHGKVQFEKDKEIDALVWTPQYSPDSTVALIEDSEYVGNYRIIVNNNQWNQKLPIISMAKVSSFHEFQNILRDCELHISFSLKRYKK